jgi:hypothetical protein
MLWLTILKKIKVAKPVPESLAFYRIRENSISTSKIDLIKYNFGLQKVSWLYFAIVTTPHGGVLFTQLAIKPIISRKLKHRFKLFQFASLVSFKISFLI